MPPLSQPSLSSLVRDLPRSGIRDFFEIVQSMEDVISLGIGEPDFITPWHIREAAIYALEQGKTSYTSNLGDIRLRRAISSYLEKELGVAYHPTDEVLVTVGASEAIDLALRALLEEGDEVIYHEPCYVSYAPTIGLARGKAVPVTTRASDGFLLRAVDVEAAITTRTKVLMLNFPTNPTGAVMPREELAKIATLCEKHNLVVISDEIYSELVYDEARHYSIASFPRMKERTILIHGVSKSFAMTGWRIGFACGPAFMVEGMMKIHQYSILCAPIISQEAAIEALLHGERSIAAMREEYCVRRNLIVEGWGRFGGQIVAPQGSFYLFADISNTGLTSRQFALQLLDQKKVAVVPGTAFGPGGEGFIRCSYATKRELLEEAMLRIGEFVREL